jgi:hypothetical protein
MPRLGLGALICIFTLTSAAGRVDADMEAAQLKFPDVVAVKVKSSGTDRFDFDAIISSPYDTPQRYADAFRVVSRDGRCSASASCCTTTLMNSRSERFVQVFIPRSVHTVVVRARDQKYGYSGRQSRFRCRPMIHGSNTGNPSNLAVEPLAKVVVRQVAILRKLVFLLCVSGGISASGAQEGYRS